MRKRKQNDIVKVGKGGVGTNQANGTDGEDTIAFGITCQEGMEQKVVLME